MAKRKKNESIAELRKRASEKEIMDISPPPMVPDLEAKDENINKNGTMETSPGAHRKPDTMVFSMRMLPDELFHFKQLAREKSAKEYKDVSYQRSVQTEARNADRRRSNRRISL